MEKGVGPKRGVQRKGMKTQSIGLLVCDHIHEDFRHLEDSYPVMFQRLLPNASMVPYYVCDNHFPVDVADHDIYICTGSKYSVYDDMDWIKRLLKFVKDIYDLEKRFVGICFGHQVMAQALGGKVEKAEVGWCIGAHYFEILAAEPWMAPRERNHINLMLCQDQVTHLPPNSRVLSTGKHCKIGMFIVGETMLGIQAHPEFTKEYNQAVFIQRRKRIGEEKVAIALESLGQPIDDALIGQWIWSFIQNGR